MNPTLLRTLTLAPGQHPRGLGHLGAASGLVLLDGVAHVVGDDELHLGVFACTGDEGGRLVRLLDGELPDEPKARKALKPDLESLFRCPPLSGYPNGALMAFGSGSTPGRERAVWLSTDTGGVPGETSLAALYAPLRHRFPDLNIEGAWEADGRLNLLQRGHAGAPHNACITYRWTDVARWLETPVAEVPVPVSVTPFSLGLCEGVPLCFTDGAPLDNGAWVFCAVAEATDSSYLDGACVGAAIGEVGPDGLLARLEWLDHPWKVEGIAATRRGSGWRLTLVTDADDPALPASLLAIDWA